MQTHDNYLRLRICINKIKITDYKDYERWHWEYRAGIQDYSHVVDPLGELVVNVALYFAFQ